MNGLFFSQKGYTIVETMIASALLMAVIVPAAMFLGKATVNYYSRDIIVATQLAKEEMENTVTFESYENDTKKIALNSKNWIIKKKINEKFGLVEIIIQVFKKNKFKPVLELKTLRVVYD